MFAQPGFELLFQAWSDAFEINDDGTPRLDASTAIAKTIIARKEVRMLTGLDELTVATLENIACRYAQVMPVFLEERVYA
jgi:hypothetical protein